MFTIGVSRAAAVHVVVAAVVALAACGKGEQNPPANPPAAPAATPAPVAPAVTAASNGQAVFARTCQTCHQVTGLGLPNTFPPLAGSPYVNGDKGKLIRIALHGLQGPITVEGKRFSNVMPPWKALNDADMAAVLTYVRSSFGNSSSAVTPEEVAHERAATASRTTMWTIQELERSR